LAVSGDANILIEAEKPLKGSEWRQIRVKTNGHEMQASKLDDLMGAVGFN
jgi:hypothetical protein